MFFYAMVVCACLVLAAIIFIGWLSFTDVTP
jgi:hypothetical protein